MYMSASTRTHTLKHTDLVPDLGGTYSVGTRNSRISHLDPAPAHTGVQESVDTCVCSGTTIGTTMCVQELLYTHVRNYYRNYYVCSGTTIH